MFDGKIIAITGWTWTWGRSITKMLLEKYDVWEVIIISRSEEKQVSMEREFNNKKLRFILCDIRNESLLKKSLEGVNYLIHAAALKHVYKCEENKEEAMDINIQGTQSVISAAIYNCIEKVIYISTDKAVEPINTYWITKAEAEKNILKANTLSPTIFFVLRAWNILWSSGSVLRVFIEQIKNQRPVTATNLSANRFYISIWECLEIIEYGFHFAKGWEIYVPNCKILALKDLLDIVLSIYWNWSNSVIEVWLKTWEKKDEILITKREASKTYSINNQLYVIDTLERNWFSTKISMEEFSTQTANKHQAHEIKKIIVNNEF